VTNFWHIFYQEISPALSLQHQDRFRQTSPQPLWRLLRQLTGLLPAPRACRWKTCPGFPWQPCKRNDVLFNKPFLLSPARPCSAPVDSYPAVVYPLIWLRVPDPGQHVRNSHLYLICCLTAIRGGDHYLRRNAQHWLYFNQLNHFTDSHATKSSENKFAGKIRSFLNHALFYLCDTFPLFLPAQSWNNFIMPPAGAEQMTLRICARVLSRRHRFILTNGPEIGFFRSILTCCQTISVRDQVQQW